MLGDPVDIPGGNGDIIRHPPVDGDSDLFQFVAEVEISLPAIPADGAADADGGGDPVPLFEAVDFSPEIGDFPGKLMADGYLPPPGKDLLVDANIAPANAHGFHADEHFIGAEFRPGHFLKRDAFPGEIFYQG
jgi:hypothetical protein